MTVSPAFASSFITIKDLSRIFGISRSTIYRALVSGALPAKKLGRKTVIDAVEAERWWSNATRPAVFIRQK
jgi:excisionase family DNA binding protein